MKQQVINGLQDHEIKVMLDYMFTDDISEFLESFSFLLPPCIDLK